MGFYCNFFVLYVQIYLFYSNFLLYWFDISCFFMNCIYKYNLKIKNFIGVNFKKLIDYYYLDFSLLIILICYCSLVFIFFLFFDYNQDILYIICLLIFMWGKSIINVYFQNVL